MVEKVDREAFSTGFGVRPASVYSMDLAGMPTQIVERRCFFIIHGPFPFMPLVGVFARLFVGNWMS